MSIISDRLKTGIIDENPIFIQVIGMCPTLAVTSSAVNGAGMGLASTAVLIGSNVVISLLRKVIPKEIRIPAFIVIIATFVTILQFLLQGYAPALNEQLGIFIPLIVVNCLILGRAEAYASKNNVFSSIFDAIGMGLGFTISLTVLGAIREIFGNGTIFDGSALALRVMPASYDPALIMVLAPGAFITLGILMAILNQRKINKKKKTTDDTCCKI